ILVLYMLFIVFNRKKNIIKDTGLLKNLFIPFGLFLVFTSMIFYIYNSYLGCFINFLLKHVGITLSLVFINIYVTLGRELGITNIIINEGEKYDIINTNPLVEEKCNENTESSSQSNTIEIIEAKINFDNEHNRVSRYNNRNCEKLIMEYETNYYKILILYKLMNSLLNPNQNDDQRDNMDSFINKNIIGEKIQLKNVINIIIKNIRNTHSTLLNHIILFPMFIILTIYIIISKFIYYEKTYSLNIVQNESGEWYYKCTLETMDFIYNIFEMMYIIFIIIKGKNIIYNNCIFRCIKNIMHSMIIWIVFGPLINIIGFLFLQNKRYNRILLEIIWNSIGYLIIFILFSMDKIHTITTGRDDSTYYFDFINHKKCLIHNSYICGCPVEKSNKNRKILIEKYILFYKYCSELYTISNGKLKYVSVNKKLNV
ncbi:hypothetical protein BCR36DRAFT_253704, partial [Piromyces finnis]